jgi:hypothetical protein
LSYLKYIAVSDMRRGAHAAIYYVSVHHNSSVAPASQARLGFLLDSSAVAEDHENHEPVLRNCPMHRKDPEGTIQSTERVISQKFCK